MRIDRRLVVRVSLFVASLLVAQASPRAVEPGVDIAAPRVANTDAGASGLSFTPSVLRVEPGDYVRWRWISGAHTTTSGSPCVANGLWNSPLTSTATSFTRQFNEAPGSFPFFCQPHCGFGMTGQVQLTTLINLDLADLSGAPQLTWSGGGGSYRVLRSTLPTFGPETVTLTSTTQTSFLDTTGGTPPVGQANFYLVMNQF